jgi:hypothetical protein
LKSPTATDWGVWPAEKGVGPVKRPPGPPSSTETLPGNGPTGTARSGSKQEDYRFGGESLSRRKLRDLQNQANAPGRRISYPSNREKKVDRRLLEQAERDYVLEVAQRADGAGATRGDATLKALVGQTMRGRPKVPRSLRFSSGITRAEEDLNAPLDFFSLRESAGLGGDVRRRRLVPGPAAG